MKFILGTKQSMTQRYDASGSVQPVTVIQAGPCVITQVMTAGNDRSTAVQIGFGSKRQLKKPQAGHLKGLSNFRYLREIALDEVNGLERGATIRVDTFKPGDVVNVIGTSKGHGFQGVVKRHKFSGSPASHGHKDQLRMPGSIGGGLRTRVPKGMRMAGRMGGDRVTVQNLTVIDVDAEANLLYVRGAVPGARHSLVLINGEGDLQLQSTVATERPVEAKTPEIPATEPAAPVTEPTPEGTKPSDDAAK